MADPVFTSEEILAFVADPTPTRMDSMFAKLNAIAGTKPTIQAEPTLIILGGSPGVGKSTFIKTQIVDKKFGITGNDYFVISHDNIMENFKPFQDDIRRALEEKTGIVLPKNYRGNNSQVDANYAIIEPELSSLSGQYVKYFNPHNPHKLNIVRNLLFQEAMKRNYNIMYDTTFTSKKDIIGEFIAPYLSTSYKDIHVIHIYATPSTIERHLNARHKAFMKQKNYMRAIPKKMVGFFLGDNKAGFKNVVRGHGGDPRFKFYEYDNTTYDGVLTPVLSVPNTESNNSSNGTGARRNNTKKRSAAAAAAAPNNSSKNMDAKTQRARASSKKAVNMLGPVNAVAPLKSKNANETAEVAVAANVLPKPKGRAKPTAVVPVPVAPSVPETTSGRPKRETKSVVRYGQ
jgi:hypothetical protein